MFGLCLLSIHDSSLFFFFEDAGETGPLYPVGAGRAMEESATSPHRRQSPRRTCTAGNHLSMACSQLSPLPPPGQGRRRRTTPSRRETIAGCRLAPAAASQSHARLPPSQ